jgi:hypothetical protein
VLAKQRAAGLWSGRPITITTLITKNLANTEANAYFTASFGVGDQT